LERADDVAFAGALCTRVFSLGSVDGLVRKRDVAIELKCLSFNSQLPRQKTKRRILWSGGITYLIAIHKNTALTLRYEEAWRLR
jgi:hypothetical protein